jgi:hypothetical protein
MIGCMGEGCKFFFTTDTFMDWCELANEPCRGKCIGIEVVKDKQEKIMSKIGKLMNEYEDLCEFQRRMLK